MEDRLWKMVLKVVPDCETSVRQLYSDRLIYLVGLWAVLHDRPMQWACQAENWSPQHRPAALPHASTLCRRWRSDGLARYAQRAQEKVLAALGRASPEAAIDGQPLLISDYSRDPDARNGRAMRHFRRGYKLHAVVDAAGVIRAHAVAALNVNERKLARVLLPQVSGAVRRVLGDGNYDSAALQRLTQACRLDLYTPIQNDYAGPRTHPRRRWLAALMKQAEGQRFLARREQIERRFGLLGNLGFGLKGLPNWVRRLHRVRRWVSGKILLYHAWKLKLAHVA